MTLGKRISAISSESNNVLYYATSPITLVAGWMCECGHKIQFQSGIAICNECGKQYSSTGEEVKQI